MTHTVYRTCSLCEACCGLAFEVEGDRIVSVRPDHEDVFSKGYICPKGIAMADVHNDPDRLRTPVRRDRTGNFQPISWEEAYTLVATRLADTRAHHGCDAVGVYIGNPVVHNHGALLLRRALLQTIGSRNNFSAGSQDTSPRFAASYYLYGGSLMVPIPDLDRTQYLLCVGANPAVSNGSFLTAPDVRGRLRALRERGGKIVVVDPRRSETARDADEHVAIRPGGDAAFLLAMVAVLVERGRVERARVSALAEGWEEIAARLPVFAPQCVERFTGIKAATIERLALEFADAPTAAAYARIGVCNNRFGTLASFATDLLNLAAGRLGEIGGAMFTSPAIDVGRLSPMLGDGHGRWHSRLRGLPETLGDLPAAVLAEEIETPGQGQIRALFTYAGNPVLLVPNGRRLDAALGKLEFMASIDLYINETTRHADVILPPRWTLAEDHVDLLPTLYSARNVVRWSPPVIEPSDSAPADWQILLELIERLGGGPTGMRPLDRLFRLGRRLGLRWRPTTTADLLLRLGRYGDHFLPWSRGLNLKKLAQAPHGIDLGPLEPGVTRRVLHKNRKIQLAAPPLLAALDELAQVLDQETPDNEVLLIGRRDLRSNNSWMHNVPRLVSGRERCVLFVHPADAKRAGIGDGEEAMLESRVHRGAVRVRVNNEMREGVVSLPHGWGHAPSASWQRTAGAHAGVSVNDWTDDQMVESVVGRSILNGVPIRLHPAPAVEQPAAASIA